MLFLRSWNIEGKQLTHPNPSQEDQNAITGGESDRVQEGTVGWEDFEYVMEGIPMAQIGNSGEGAVNAVTQQTQPFSGDLHRTVAAPDLNRIAIGPMNSVTEDLIEDGDERTTTEAAPRLGLRPFRPPPPTVKVYSLHKPQEIPNDVLGALLCLRKNCNHDHSKIRLIGSKVIVYSGAKSTRSRARRRSLRNSRESRTPCVHREPSAVVGEQILSDDFELEEDLTSVSTQTETTTPPTSVMIRTEAFLQDENDKSTPCFGGTMTGTLLLAKDSFDTKFIGGSWNQVCNTSLKENRFQFSNVRESIVKSRPDIADLDDHFAELHERLGTPHANSTIKEEGTPDPNTVETEQFFFVKSEECLKSSVANSSSELSSTQCCEQEEVNQNLNKTLESRDFEFNGSKGTVNGTPSSTLRLAQSLTYTGSNTVIFFQISYNFPLNTIKISTHHTVN